MSFMERAKNNREVKPKCIKCGLYNTSPYPKIGVTGLGEKEILIVRLSATSDINTPEQYQQLAFQLKKLGVHIYNDCWTVNIVDCVPLDEAYTTITMVRNPNAKEIKYCSIRIESIIKKLSPKKIILLAEDTTVSAFYADRYHLTALAVRGQEMYDPLYKCYVYPISNTMLESSKELPLCILRRDLQRAVSATKTYTALPDVKEHASISIDFDECCSFITGLHNEALIALDYETTGLKPFAKGQRVVSIAVTTSNLKTFSIPLQHNIFTKEQQDSISLLWRDVLINSKIAKIIHNINFEYMWSAFCFNCTPASFFWDTQLAAHVLDNRAAITKLKHQLFINFGIPDYASEITPFLEAHEGGNSFNTVEKCPIHKLLRYGAIDSFGTMLLYKKQRSELKNGMLTAFKFFMRSAHTLASMQLNGMYTNEEFYKEIQTKIDAELKPIVQSINNDPYVKEFELKENYVFQFTSVDDLKILFFDHMKISPIKLTAKNNNSVDEEVLNKIDHPIAKAVLTYRKLEKLKSTYINNILLETYNGKMHPFFSLNTVVSLRSSSSSINFQNLPKRDKKAMKKIRTGIIPPPDHYISESDFSGAEVVTSLAYHKDPTFKAFLTDSNKDMHRHVASKSFMLEESEVLKNIRRDTKALTFGWFYGSYYGLLAPIAWEFAEGHTLANGTPLREHLANNGINDIHDFMDHMKDVEYYFWNEMFPVYTKWKKDIVIEYKRNGFIDTYFGFRFTAPMDEKQCTNYPIQSTSFHMLLYTLNDVAQDLKKYKMKSRLSGQIHDSMIGLVHKDEIVQYHDIIEHRVGDLINRLPWLPIPMKVECEISALHEEGGNFANMTEYKRENFI